MPLLAEGESREKRADELLRSGRLVFLQTAGYTTAQIIGFGDLTKLPDEKMSELLHNKIDNAIANILGESMQKQHRRVKKIGGRKRRR
jgi:hypothetical protein